MPRNSKLVAEVGETRVYVIEECPDILVRAWLVKTSDEVVKEMIINMVTFSETIFDISFEGPGGNILCIKWQQKDPTPTVPDHILPLLHLAISNVNGGNKKLRFLLENAFFKTDIPYDIKPLEATHYQMHFPVQQITGAENPKNSKLVLDSGLSSGKALITDEDRGVNN